MSTAPATHTAFLGPRCIASGDLATVALAAQAALTGAPDARVTVIDDTTGRAVGLSLHGTPAQLRQRLERRAAREAAAHAAPAPRSGPGRPRLGVVSREVTLLPRHWEWLGSQPAGISATLRRLVEDARRASAGHDEARRARDAVDHFMALMAGDLPGYEEASRALYAGDWKRLDAQVRGWPPDIRDHARRLAAVARERLAAAQGRGARTAPGVAPRGP